MKKRIIVWTLALTATTVADFRSSHGRPELNPLGKPAIVWSLNVGAVAAAIKTKKPKLLLIPIVAHGAAAIHNAVTR